jgi:arylsulfatase A
MATDTMITPYARPPMIRIPHHLALLAAPFLMMDWSAASAETSPTPQPTIDPARGELSESGRFIRRVDAATAIVPDPAARLLEPGLSADQQWIRIGGVELDRKSLTVTIPATVNQLEGAVEYFLVHQDGKVHETVFSTHAKPQDIHVACLLAGWRQEEEPAELDIHVTWETNGPARSHRAEELVALARKHPQERDGSHLGHGPWEYLGSRMDAAGFAAAREGSIIALISDPTALVGNPRPGRLDDALHAPNRDLLPAMGHPVRITLSKAPPAETPPAPSGAPNLLIIVGHEIGYGDLQCNGAVATATPALDSLAHDGIRFTQFTTTGGGAHAAQFALLTGRVAARSGMGGEPPPPGTVGWRSGEWSLAEALHRRGYHTAFIGEWLLGDAEGSHPNDQGFQLFHGLPHALAYRPPLVENRAVVSATPDPQQLQTSLTGRALAYLTESTQPFALVFHPPAVVPANASSAAGPHGARIEALDASVAQLLAALDSRGISSQTMVIFLGNGGAPRTAAGGSNGIFRDGAGTAWEGGLRTPLLARLPGILPAAQHNLSLIWLPDLMPTLTTLAGADLAEDRPMDGTSRAGAFAGSQHRPGDEDTAYGFRHHDGQWRIATIRQGKWKTHLSITRMDPENTRPTNAHPLYDLHVDAEERTDFAAGNPAILARLNHLATTTAATLPAAGDTDLPHPEAPTRADAPSAP